MHKHRASEVRSTFFIRVVVDIVTCGDWPMGGLTEISCVVSSEAVVCEIPLQIIRNTTASDRCVENVTTGLGTSDFVKME